MAKRGANRQDKSACEVFHVKHTELYRSFPQTFEQQQAGPFVRPAGKI